MVLKRSRGGIRRGVERLLNSDTYKGKVIRLCELAGNEGVLEGLKFIDCTIKGPAVLTTQGDSQLNGNTFEGDLDAILWEVPPSRTHVMGIILAKDCTFEGCTFENIGIAGPPELIERLKESIEMARTKIM